MLFVFSDYERRKLFDKLYFTMYAHTHTHTHIFPTSRDERVRNIHIEKWLHPFWTFLLHFLHQWKTQCEGESEESWRNNFFSWSILTSSLSSSGSRILLFFLLFLWRKFSIHCVCRIEWLSDNVITLAVLYEEEIVWLIRALQLK
jgi:hypothetical protein